MKKIGWRAISLFVIAFAVTLLVKAPASLLAGVVASKTNGQFVLANAAGTVWKGSATPSVRQRAGTFVTLEKLHWDIDLLPLFTGKLLIHLNWDNVEASLPMTAKFSWGNIELRNVIIPVEAGLLGEFSPYLQPLKLTGQIKVSSDVFIYSKAGLLGSATADWTNAGMALSAVSPLGSYQIELTGAGEKLDLSLSTLTGVLLLEGQGSFTVSQGLKLQMTARASANSKGSIDELLNNLGPQSSPGIHTINLSR
jgi:general secretion pathway protein N